jgi:uroporphyrinogen decarboxylase
VSLANDTLLRALLRQPTEHTPIWLMRQAGRYLPEYMATRQRAGSFLALAKTPALATEVTLQPLERFPLDAAILFSDILTVPDAMGLGLYFSDGEGPRFERPVRDASAIDRLPIPAPEAELRYVLDAVAEIRRALARRVPLIGFAGSPFTLACYMIEGGPSEDFARLKALMYDQPLVFHRLLGKVAAAVAVYLDAQIQAGAEAVMLFDTWGGTLTEAQYREFSLHYMTSVFDRVRRQAGGQVVPRIAFTKGGGSWLEHTAGCGCDAVGLDWSIDIGQARRRIGDRVALQGNLDPAALLASPQVVVEQAQYVLTSFGSGPGHVFNLGHGISRWTPPENVAALVHAVREKSRNLHKPGASLGPPGA